MRRVLLSKQGDLIKYESVEKILENYVWIYFLYKFCSKGFIFHTNDKI